MTFNTVTLVGASRHRYSFRTQSSIWPMPIAGGVYFHARRNPATGLLELLYVGRALNFQVRHYDHHREEQLKRSGANIFGWMWIAGEVAQHSVEQDIIRAYRPPLNWSPVPRAG